MGEQCEALVAGHICLDIIPDFSDSRTRPEALFAPGSLVRIGRPAISSGGPVSNTGLALHRLGVRTRLVGKTGDDLFGRALREAMEACGSGLSSGLVADGKTDTSYTLIVSPPGMDRIFFHCPGANDEFRADDVTSAHLAGVRLFHFGYPPVMRRMFSGGGRELTELFRRAKAEGATTSLDLTLPDPASEGGRADWGKILRNTLPFVDVFIPSFEEILFMLRRPLYDGASRSAGGALAAAEPALLPELGAELAGMGPAIVGLKLGDRGLYLRTSGREILKSIGRARPADAGAWADRELISPCFDVTAAGTTGAGDATFAGFLAALLKGSSPEDSVTAAVAVGACCVEALDAVSGIRSWEETLRRIRSGWSRKELMLAPEGWRLDAESRLWLH
ncbi:MAG: carbohydrate kinase family protein [Spirochaetales bacterium]|nr:carbohydrate kinase family protein [Spirochaetales bacterium]